MIQKSQIRFEKHKLSVIKHFKNVKDQACTLLCYGILCDGWTMILLSNMYSFQCLSDAYEFVYLFCVAQRGFI